GDRRSGHLGILALVPHDRQRLERGLGLPPGIADDGDGRIADRHDVLHSLAAGDLGRIEALDLAAMNRTGLDRGVHHAGQSYVDGVKLLACQLVARVEPLERFTGNFPILRIFELDVSGRLDLRSRFRHFAVGGGAGRRLVRDDAVRRAALGRGHLPLVRSSLDQHFTRCRAALAHVVLGFTDAAASGAAVIAPYPFAGDVLPRRRIFGRHLRPVAFELLRAELGAPGERALAHFGAGDANDDRVVGADHHPGIDLRRDLLSTNCPRASEGKLQSERQPAAHGGCAHDEAAAVDFRYVIHGRLPYALATTAWIAARI